MYKQICYCDLCGDEIQHPDRDGVIRAGGSQVWPIGEKEYDVCGFCLSILLCARTIGIAQMDFTPLLTRAGYTWDGSGWARKIGESMEYASEPE